MSAINEKELLHLADLARIEIKDNEKEKLLKDLGEILSYVEELKSVNTENIEPLAGGTDLINSFRADEPYSAETSTDELDLTVGPVVEAFPEQERHYNKVSPVFE